MPKSRSKGRADRQLRAKERRAFAAEAALSAALTPGPSPQGRGESNPSPQGRGEPNPSPPGRGQGEGVTVEVFPDDLRCVPALAGGEPETPLRELDDQGGRTGRPSLAPPQDVVAESSGSATTSCDASEEGHVQRAPTDPLARMSAEGRKIALGVASASRIAQIREA